MTSQRGLLRGLLPMSPMTRKSVVSLIFVALASMTLVNSAFAGATHRELGVALISKL